MRWMTVMVLVAAIGSTAQADDVQNRIRKGAVVAGASLVKADYKVFADSMYPRLLELLGGSEQLIAMLEAGREQMRSTGADIVAMEVKDVSAPVVAGSEKHAVVTYTLQMAVSGGTLYQEAYLLAISQDDGSTWTYVDGNGLSPEKVGILLPDFNKALVLPDKSEPRFVPE